MFTYIKSCTRFLFVCLFVFITGTELFISASGEAGLCVIAYHRPKTASYCHFFLSKTEHLDFLNSTLRRRDKDDRDFFICLMLAFEPRTWHVHSDCVAAELQPQLWRLLFFFKYLLLLSSIMCVLVEVVDGKGPVRTEVSQPHRAGVILWLIVSSLN